jgi:glycosyltransferase involved in cell wall biosynthesis
MVALPQQRNLPDMKHILLFIPGYLPGYKSGGPVRTVANLVEALGDEFSFNVVCLDRDSGDTAPYGSVIKGQWNRQGKANVFYIKRGIFGVISLISIIRNTQFDIVHLNSFLSFQFSVLPLLMVRILRPEAVIFLGPRGEFSLGALSLKSFKKRVFVTVCRWIGLHKNVIWHASTSFEAQDIKRVMGESAVLRTAIDLAMTGNDVEPAVRVSEAPLRVVFISRISPKKNLMGALSLLQSICREIHFDVYGPIDDEAYWTACQETATLLPSNIVFTYCGTLQPSEVVPTLVKYDLFFFPTFGENFGHVIAEALFAGLPILISDTTPWRHLEQMKLGWDIPLDQPDRFIACIGECYAKPAGEYAKWRCDIRRWALANIGGHGAIEENRVLFNNPIKM